MTELIVIRHGETDWNRALRFQGQIDVPLNALGLAQADRLAERLAERRAGETIDAIVASDLDRARTTAERTASRLGLPVSIDAAWREQAFGLFEGLDVPTLRSRHAELWAQYVRHEAGFALPRGGESMLAFQARVRRGLQSIAIAHPGERVALFTHGGVLDVLWRIAGDLPWHGPRACEIPNTGINRLHWHQGRLKIVRWADAAHLNGLPPQPSTVPASLRDRACLDKNQQATATPATAAP